MGLSSSVGRSVPILANVLQLNPASLPTLPTPVGVEATYSSTPPTGASSRFKASVIKGFEGFGLGLGSLGPGDFAAPALGTTSVYNSVLSSVRQGYQFGSSLKVPTGVLEELLHLNLGASVGQISGAGSPSWTYGLVSEIRWLHIGYSVQRQDFSNQLPAFVSGTLSLGLQFESIYFGFSRLSWLSPVLNDPTSIYSLRYAGSSWSVYGALKRYRDTLGTQQSWTSAAVQYQFGDHFALGYVYGLQRYSSSLNAQFFF